MVHNPELRTQPVGVRQKSLLVTTNYVARALGVPKMIKVSDAKQKFPDLVIIDGECLDSYREVVPCKLAPGRVRAFLTIHRLLKTYSRSLRHNSPRYFTFRQIMRLLIVHLLS